MFLWLFILSFSQASEFQEYWEKRHALFRLDQIISSPYLELPGKIDGILRWLSNREQIHGEIIWASFPDNDVSCGEIRARYRRSQDYFNDLFHVLSELKTYSEKFFIERNGFKKVSLQKKISESLVLVERFRIRLLNIFNFDSEDVNNNIMLLWKSFLHPGENIESVELQEARLPTEIWYKDFLNSPVRLTFSASEIRAEFEQPFSISCFKSDPVLLRLEIVIRNSMGLEKRDVWFGSEIPVMR